MSTITAKDGAQIYYKDWGRGQPVVMSHGWPLSADAWEDQMLFLATRGYRCVAHDRRGHGRSSQPGSVIGASAMRTAHMVKGATLKVVPGAPHGLCSTLKDQVNAELLAFFKT